MWLVRVARQSTADHPASFFACEGAPLHLSTRSRDCWSRNWLQHSLRRSRIAASGAKKGKDNTGKKYVEMRIDRPTWD